VLLLVLYVISRIRLEQPPAVDFQVVKELRMERYW